MEYPKYSISSSRETYSSMFSAALDTIARKLKQPKHVIYLHNGILLSY